ncbi:MAG: hypothetical protein ACOX51_11085 [Myxococcota bacterium]|nr:metallophosphoesterase [Myxococcota bacterium]OQC42719.1 MAG: Calcineurin-like phosphoesterase superfamily domain protein [Deltaproteobacteria bacterium ADurb.Bin058]HHW95952.1 hypothetical protein [Oligoflexales bacterium]MBP8970820.1 metallophosphoesterase [Myxococcota bacterium]HOE82849.1 hypothetical protein [Myxococcota bacterium]
MPVPQQWDATAIKIVFSDVHLGTGEHPGLANPYEDFRQDDRLAELILHHCQGAYEQIPVEIIINGDFMDLLKIPIGGAFPLEVDEDIAVEKVRRVIRGHPEVFDAMATFVRVPGHTITYIPGNHDVEVAFPRAQNLIRARLNILSKPELFQFYTEHDTLRLPSGIVVTHGNNFEAMNSIEPGRFIVDGPDGKQIAAVPFGSRFLIHSLLPFKAEQPLLDQVHPLSTFLLWGLVFDLRFTLRLLSRMATFLFATRFSRSVVHEIGWFKAISIFIEEVSLFTNMERRAIKVLKESDDISALIVGHNHKATIARFPRNKIYVNTGTWLKLVSLDLTNLGTRTYLTYAQVEYRQVGPPAVRLMRWRGRPKEVEELSA